MLSRPFRTATLALTLQAFGIASASCFPYAEPRLPAPGQAAASPAAITIAFDNGGDVQQYEARVDAAVASGAFVRISYYATCISACSLWLDARLIAANHLCVDNDATFETHEARVAPHGEYLADQSERSDASTAAIENRLDPGIRAAFDRYGVFAGPWLTSFSGELIRDANSAIPQCTGGPAAIVAAS